MRIEEHPFYKDPWRAEEAEAARAIWDWHVDLAASVGNPEIVGLDLETEAARVRDDLSTELVSREVTVRARDIARRYKLDTDEFASQVVASGRLTGSLSFAEMGDLNAFIDSWVGPVGRLLASLAGVGGILHVGRVNSLTRGFFMLGRLLTLPEDVAEDRLFIPQSEMEVFGVRARQLEAGPPDEAVKKMLWKQCVRVRDSFARALPLSLDLPRRYSVGFRRWWLGGLEMVNAIERRGYDVWTGPVVLSPYHRAQARFQARFARAAFKRSTL